jgi:hypothetical protein
VGTTRTASRTSTARRRAFTILAVVFGVVGALTFGAFGLVGGWFESGDRIPHRVHDVASGIVFGLLIAVPFLLQAVRPEGKVAPMQQAAFAILAIIVAAALSLDPDVLGLVLIFGIPWVLLFWLHPVRAEVLRLHGGTFSPILAAITAAAAVPLTVFALPMAEPGRQGVR